MDRQIVCLLTMIGTTSYVHELTDGKGEEGCTKTLFTLLSCKLLEVCILICLAK